MRVKRKDGATRDAEMRWRPPDGGWGWVVAVSNFIGLMLMTVPTLCYSILFSHFLMERGASTTFSNWVMNLHMFLHNLMAVCVGPLTSDVGFRRVALAVMFLNSFCVFCLVFVNSTWYLMVFFSIAGIFEGMSIRIAQLLIISYFDRRRGAANAFLTCGICSSQFVGPPVLRYLLDEYSLQGALLIVSGVMLNGLVTASLYQPPEWHLKPHVTEDEGDAETGKDYVIPDEDEKVYNDKFTGVVCGDARSSKETIQRRTGDRDECEKQKLTVDPVHRRHSLCSARSLGGSLIDVGVEGSVTIPDDSHQRDHHNNKEEEDAVLSSSFSSWVARTLRGLQRLCVAVLRDMTVIKSARAMIICAGGVLSIVSYFCFIVLVPFSVQNFGFSLSDAAWCLSVAAIVNILTRLFTSTLSDYHWFSMRAAYMAGTAIKGTTAFVIGYLTNLKWILVTMALWGCGLGMNISLCLIIVPRVMGLEKMEAVLGTQSLLVGIGFVTLGPLIGVIRDATQSYKVALAVTGLMDVLCVLLWFLMPLAVKWDKRKEEEEKEEEEEERRKQVKMEAEETNFFTGGK